MKKFKWRNIEKTKPICYKTGDWDGKKSDEILISDFNGKFHVVTCYETILQGEKIYDFYDSNDYEVGNFLLWTEIPEP